MMRMLRIDNGLYSPVTKNLRSISCDIDGDVFAKVGKKMVDGLGFMVYGV